MQISVEIEPSRAEQIRKPQGSTVTSSVLSEVLQPLIHCEVLIDQGGGIGGRDSAVSLLAITFVSSIDDYALL